MTDLKICPVLIAGDIEDGMFANAFRVVREDSSEVYLDFLLYSSDRNEAIVVSRVRVSDQFIPSILDQLSAKISEKTVCFSA